MAVTVNKSLRWWDLAVLWKLSLPKWLNREAGIDHGSSLGDVEVGLWEPLGFPGPKEPQSLDYFGSTSNLQSLNPQAAPLILRSDPSGLLSD